MAGTKAGGLKARDTNIERHGLDFYAKIGRMGGHNSHTGGFASMPREQVSAAGRKGGLKSKRGIAMYGRGEDGKPLTRSQAESRAHWVRDTIHRLARRQ